MNIASTGYQSSKPYLASFFPVYPAVVRLCHVVFGGDFAVIGLVVSWLSLVAATWGIIALTDELCSANGKRLRPDGSTLRTANRTAIRAAVLFVWFPASVFLLAPYGDALFAALVAWALVFMVQRRWPVAAILVGVASATRPEGALLAFTLFLVLLHRRRFRAAVAWGAVGLSGLVAVSIVMLLSYHNLFEPAHVQHLWRRQLTWPFHTIVWPLSQILLGHRIGNTSFPPQANLTAVFLLDVGCILLGLTAVIWLVRRARFDQRLLPLAIFAVLDAMAIMFNGTGPGGRSPEAAERLVMMMVPMYVWAASLRREEMANSLLAGFASLAALFEIFFHVGLWLT